MTERRVDLTSRRPSRRCRAALVAAGVVASVLVSSTGAPPAVADTEPVDPGAPETVSADALPTVQVDGVVWDQLIVGDRVYVTGEFTAARPAGSPPGVGETPRSNILAYDLETGELITSWAPALNNQGLVLAASADGSRIFVGGDFSQVSGESRNRVAAIDAATGQVVPGFSPQANTRVSALAVNGGTLYLGGHFTIVAGQSRTRLAAVDATSGQLLPWAPTADREVGTMTVHPASGRVIVGGTFYELNGVEQWGMGSLHGTTGELMPWAANTVIRNGGPNTHISGLATDGDRIYGTGWAYFGAGGTTANFEGSFSADPLTGELDWVNGCRGDTYDLTVTGDVLYTVSHQHDCGMVGWLPEESPRTEHRTAASDKRGSLHGQQNEFGPYSVWQPFAGMPANDMLHWLPTLSPGVYTGQGQAAWTVTANDTYVVEGGEFRTVNGQAQQGLVRFAVEDVAPNDEGPLRFDEVKPALTPLAPGTVRVDWRAAWDRDNERLTYEVLRGPSASSSTVLASFELDSMYWDRPPLAFVDTTAPPGSIQTYRIRVTDPFGNGGPSASTTVTVPTGAAPTSEYHDRVRANGAIHHWRLGEPSGTTARDWIRSNDLTLGGGPQRGADGALLDGDDPATSWPGSTSTNTIRGVSEWWQPGPQTFSVEAWFRTTSNQGGKIVGFGNSNGGTFSTAATGRSNSNLTDRHVYLTNDGQVRFGLRPDMGERRTIQSGAGYNDGEWHHVVATLDDGGARLYVDGDEAAHDPTLTRAQVYRGYWRVAGDRLSSWPSTPSREAFEGTIDEVAIYPHALTAAQVQGNHHASGRDGDFPNVAPTASFSAEVDGATVSVDGSSSSDPDGSVVSHVWDFGDGGSASGATAEHTYAASGTYTVTLTVTDDDGATDTATEQVDVTVAPEPDPDPTDVVASDAFARTVASGWGAADVGGAWSANVPADFSVPGGSGRIVGGVAGASRVAYLDEVAAADVDLEVTLSVDAPPSGSGTYVSLLGRRASPGTEYRAQVRFTPAGSVLLNLLRAEGFATSVITSSWVSGSYTPGDELRLRFRIEGDDLQAKLWPAGTEEPSAWTVEATDTSPALQAPGAVGILHFVSGSSSTLPVTLAVRDLTARPPA